LHLYCGIDWATAHHDVAVIDDGGRVVARGRVGNDAAGFAQLLTLLAQAGDSAEDPIPVGIETDHGLWVAALRATGRVIYPINPLAASRYRARHAVSGAKSDATDAVLLANIVRIDAAAHRPLPADTELAQAIRVLARAQQDAVWARQQIGNQIRELLKDFYPGALAAFAELPEGGLARHDARTILAAAPTPAQAAALTPLGCAGCWSRPAATDTSTATSPGCARSSPTPTCANHPTSRTRWVSNWVRCCASSTPPVRPPTSSPRRRSRILSSTRTPRSSRASPAWGVCRRPGFG
jgi:transposase